MEIYDEHNVEVVVNILQQNVDKSISVRDKLPKIIGFKYKELTSADALPDALSPDIYLVFGEDGKTKKGKPFYSFWGPAKYEIFKLCCKKYNVD